MNSSAVDNNTNSSLLKNPTVVFCLILITGFVLRIFLSLFLTYEPDFDTWIYWSKGVSSAGFGTFYDRYWCDYMPGYIYVLWLLEQIHSVLPGLSVDILYKLPANLADLGISVLIFITLRGLTSVRNAMIGALVYFFNPAVLSNSTFWGQVDSFHSFPILASIVLGLRKRFALSGIFAAMAFMIKPQSIVIFPIIGLLSIDHFFTRDRVYTLRSFLPALKMGICALFTIFIVSLPYIWNDLHSVEYIFTGPVELIKARFAAAYDQYQFASINAFNFWGSFAMWADDQILYLGFSYKTWGTIIFGFIYAAVVGLLLRFKIYSESEDPKQFTYLVLQAVTLILFTLYLFLTRAHERHLLPTIVFFTLITFRSWILWYLYSIVSVVYICNMIYSYIQLTTEYSGVPDYIERIILPGMFFLLLITYIIVFFDYAKNTLGTKDRSKSAISEF